MKTSLIALGLLAALPFAASATDGLSYNYVEGGYVNTDAKGGDADGWAVKGSVAVHPNFHVFGSYNAQETDFGKVDLDQWRLGVGYNYGIAPNTDLLARVAYQKFDPQYGSTFNGYSTEVGVRTAFTPMIEGYALAGYEDYSKKNGYDPDGEFYGRVGAAAKFNANWGVSGEVKLGKGGDKEWFVGPRFTW
ncbi:Ax21 family protein [Stenotrophomonas sp. NLF4-10]|uniref:OmpO family porin n=1 Tax=Stenotrophomonas sp. NLF4-10 TaxID=2918754 RepID=UPI001EFB65F7|nr:Ax21 family protein [Stenotrophomonas sp. NLF4-10]MCG8275247.1 Ax21 family protein [Stenotrophomonas sp. NLF4-10]